MPGNNFLHHTSCNLLCIIFNDMWVWKYMYLSKSWNSKLNGPVKTDVYSMQGFLMTCLTFKLFFGAS